MAEKSGGRAGKAGDAYEWLWVAYQALKVVEGVTYHSVLWEALGDDEVGVDVWIERTDGTREAHQCKRENGSKGRWTTAELGARGVLSAAKDQLSRDPRYRFVFVSNDSATHLCDLANRTHSCNDNPSLFVEHMVDTEERKQAFADVCRYWGLSDSLDSDVACAFDLLKRMTFVRFDLEPLARTAVESLAGYLFKGPRSEVLNALSKLLEINFGNELHADTIQARLRAAGVIPRNLAGEPSLLSSIERLQRLFDRSMDNLLIDGRILPRPETDSILRMLQEVDGPRLIFLHGNAGKGKSGVLYELTRRLQGTGTPYLPIRLDRQPPSGNPEHFGREKCDLPASPALSLDALAGQRSSVLILDQLDALRWSGAHTREAWEVCREVIEEALQLPRMRVIVTCRTFDLRDDPEIRRWKQHGQNIGQTPLKVAECIVGDLPDEQVKEVIALRGCVFETLTGRQRLLLRTPQWLYLWCELRDSLGESGAGFSTQTQLIKAFWHDRWDKLARMGISTESTRTALDEVVAYMDQKGTLCAPTSFFEPPRHVVADALRSLNVFDPNAKMIVFAHQSYVDYLVASHVKHKAMQERQTPLDWLRSHEQSLFRRDQLRQLLTLLRDDDRSLYLETLRGILFGTGIRFHLQHLVIRLLGTWDVLLDGEVDVLVELYGLLDWHEHVVREAICVNRGVFSAFCLRGVFQAQLTSGDETQLLAALRVMRWVSATFGDAVERLLEPYWTVGGVWPAWICSVLPFSADADTDRMFEFRVSQIEAGVTFQGMDFFSEQWARSAPVRCIRIAHVLISGYLSKCRADLEEAHVGEIPNWPFRDDWRDKALEIACDAAPRDAWEQFLPCATLLSSLHRIGRRGVQPYWRGSERYREMARAGTFIRRLLVASGKKLAEICPDEFEQFVAPCLKTKSLTIRRVLLASFAAGGGRLADQAIGWLCDRPKLFRAGSQYDDSRWQPAYRVIQHLSSLCSDDIYRRLEETILRYREPNEIESCRRKLRRAKDGFLTINDVGRAQNTLLCALPVSRMSSAARAIAGVWQVKFGPHLFKKREPSKFRAVVSPIPRDRLHLVSDRQWLRIIRRQWPERCWTDRDAGKDLITEASTSTFAADFAEMAKRQPQRFAALALRIPSDADPAYLSRVLGNLVTSVPPVPGSPDVGKWKPATQEQLEALLNVVGYSSDYGQATGFCDIIDRRCTATWSNAIFERLARYALIHPDPAFESAQRDLPMTEINCVRGRAAHAISRLVFEKPELSTRFLPAIEGLTRDPHPAVRLAAVQACLSLLNVDRALATRLFMQSCDVEDDRICAGHSVHEFVRYARFSHWETMIPLIERMVHSAHSEAAEEGALWVTVNWLESGLMSNLATACLSGSIAQRKGLAKAAVGLADGERTRERCLDLLMRLFDDDSEDRSARGEIHLPSP